MIPQTQKDKLKSLGLDIEQLVKAHTATDEVSIDFPDGMFYTEEQLSKRDANSKKEGIKEQKKAGEKEALEIAITEIAKHTGLSIDADKIERFGDLGKHLGEEFGKSADEKSAALKRQVADLLKDKETLTAAQQKAIDDAKNTQFEYQQYSKFPKNRLTLMDEAETLTILKKRGVEPKEEGVFLNGQLLTDPATKAALPHEKAYEQIFTDFKLIATPPTGATGGRGGGNSDIVPHGGKLNSFDEAEKAWLEQNPNGNIVSPQFQSFLNEQMKDNPTFQA